MPLLKSTYNAPRLFRNAHLSTIYAATLRKVNFATQERERLELPDSDFLDLDWSFSERKSSRLLILMHGLAGSAQRPYMLGMSKIFTENGWDTAAMNFRSCSGELNRLFRSYNGGATEDLEAVVKHVLEKKKYKEIAIAGFSLGGNLLMKYLGENRELPAEIKAAVAVSTPCDLGASLEELNKSRNFIYSKRFEKNLKDELYQRQLAFPDQIEKQEIANCNSLLAIDELYTSKAHGYKSAQDYYEKCSCLQFLPNIRIPSLIINAENDSFLSANSYPVEIAEKSQHLHLEIPTHGGHVGFIRRNKSYYHEQRTLEFVKSRI
ncbi:MAG: alpha/beta fold hydrolase [Salegentibacter sp.]